MHTITRSIRLASLTTLTGLGLLAGCSQSVGPDGVHQDAGPFHQSVGAGGVNQGVGVSRPYQSTGGAPPRVGSADCQIDCGGRTYIANCPADSRPVCQCNSQPYAGCLSPSR